RRHRRDGCLRKGRPTHEATAHRGLRRHLQGRDDRDVRRQVPRGDQDPGGPQVLPGLGGGGVLAVVGGTETFGLFLTIGYDVFYLTRTEASVPRGRAVFPGVGTHTTPEEVMAKHGLVLKGTRMLDASVNCRVEEWVKG